MFHASLLEVVHLQQVSLQLHEEVIAAGTAVHPQDLRAMAHLMHPPQEPRPGTISGTAAWRNLSFRVISTHQVSTVIRRY